MENTTNHQLRGTCLYCGKRWATTTERGHLTHHGFEISDGHHYLGFRNGSCQGTGQIAWEKSSEQGVHILAGIRTQIQDAEGEDKLTQLRRAEHHYANLVQLWQEADLITKERDENLTLIEGLVKRIEERERCVEHHERFKGIYEREGSRRGVNSCVKGLKDATTRIEKLRVELDRARSGNPVTKNEREIARGLKKIEGWKTNIKTAEKECVRSIRDARLYHRPENVGSDILRYEKLRVADVGCLNQLILEELAILKEQFGYEGE